MNSPVAAMSWSSTTAVRADDTQHRSSEHKGWYLGFRKSTSTPPYCHFTQKPKPIIQLVFQLQEILDLDTVNHDKWTRPVSFFASCVNLLAKRGIIGFHSAFWTNLSPITSPLMWNQAKLTHKINIFRFDSNKRHGRAVYVKATITMPLNVQPIVGTHPDNKLSPWLPWKTKEHEANAYEVTKH